MNASQLIEELKLVSERNKLRVVNGILAESNLSPQDHGGFYKVVEAQYEQIKAIKAVNGELIESLKAMCLLHDLGTWHGLDPRVRAEKILAEAAKLKEK